MPRMSRDTVPLYVRLSLDEARAVEAARLRVGASTNSEIIQSALDHLLDQVCAQQIIAYPSAVSRRHVARKYMIQSDTENRLREVARQGHFRLQHLIVAAIAAIATYECSRYTPQI